jgi:exodeoxyribonuclease VII small subunit
MAAKKSKAGASGGPAPEDPRGFEQRLEALEAVVRDLEGEELSLEDSLGRYQQGVEHLKACRAMLDTAEARLAELVASAEGDGLVERPLRVTDQGLTDAEES